MPARDPDFKTQGRRHQKYKTGVPVTQQKRTCVFHFFKRLVWLEEFLISDVWFWFSSRQSSTRSWFGTSCWWWCACCRSWFTSTFSRTLARRPTTSSPPRSPFSPVSPSWTSWRPRTSSLETCRRFVLLVDLFKSTRDYHNTTDEFLLATGWLGRRRGGNRANLKLLDNFRE